MLELTLERFIIQWLIWIQLIVLLLIFAFLFSFTIIVSDPTNDETAASASASASIVQIQSLANHYSPPVTVTNPLHITQGVENLSIKGEIVTSASTGIVIEEIGEGEASSLYFLHPCYYFKLARVAFLKCLGLDSMSESENPSCQRHMKEKKES